MYIKFTEVIAKLKLGFRFSGPPGKYIKVSLPTLLNNFGDKKKQQKNNYNVLLPIDIIDIFGCQCVPQILLLHKNWLKLELSN